MKKENPLFTAKTLAQNSTDIKTYLDHCTAHHFRAVLLVQKSAEFSEAIFQSCTKIGALSLQQISNYRTYLGTEQNFLVCSIAKNWHWNSLTALSATLKGSGVLLIETETCPTTLLENLPASFLHWLAFFPPGGYLWVKPLELLNFLQSGEFQKHLNRIQNTRNLGDFVLTQEQKAIFSAMSTLKAQEALFIAAARGRGKSTCLQAWCAVQSFEPHQEQQRQIYLCAPSKHQVQRILTSQSNIRFIPPDQLAQKEFHANDFLLVDEAATLPWHAQNALLHFPGALVLASTTEGYEFAGRGFLLRFLKQIEAHFKQLTTYELTKPLRWGEGDPLELATHQAFALYPSGNRGSSPAIGLENNPAQLHRFKYICHGHASQYSAQQRVEIFSLLTEAHYRTQPNDVGRLLDQPNQQLLTLWAHIDKTSAPHPTTVLVGVVWLSLECGLSTEEAREVMHGKRRLGGQLLPQTFAYYIKNTALAKMNHARIIRIAIAENQQRQGYGSELLQYCEAWAQQAGLATLGTSFGLNPELASFWLENQWQFVRLGHKPDPASRFPSAVFCKLLSKGAHSYNKELELNAWIQLHFLMNFKPFKLNQGPITKVYRTMLKRLPTPKQQDLTLLQEHWHNRGLFFVQGAYNFSDYQPWLATALQDGWAPAAFQGLSPTEIQLLNKSVRPLLNLSQLAQKLGFQGRAELLQKLKSICRKLHLKV